jgi:hypothetical protein
MNYGYPSRGKTLTLFLHPFPPFFSFFAPKTYFFNVTLCQIILFIHSIPEPTPSTMTALHQFGAEMLKLSRGLESFTPINEPENVDMSESSEARSDKPSANTLLSDFKKYVQSRSFCFAYL